MCGMRTRIRTNGIRLYYTRTYTSHVPAEQQTEAKLKDTEYRLIKALHTYFM